jgi:hypothetical protein
MPCSFCGNYPALQKEETEEKEEKEEREVEDKNKK